MGVKAQLRESTSAIAAVFRNPALARVNLALGGSVIGDWAYGVAVGVYAYLDGGATAVGVLGVVRFVTAAVLTPFSATLADRHDRRRVMVASDLVRSVLVLGAAAVIWIDGPAMAVYALAVATSLCATAFRPAQASLLPHLVRHPDELTAANVTSSTIESVGFFAGPALGGLLIAVTEIEVVFLFDALTFLWSAWLVHGMTTPAPPVDVHDRPAPGEPDDGPAAELDGPSAGDGDGAPGFLTEAAAGFRTVFASAEIRLLIGVYVAQTVVAGASLVFTVAIALDLLELDEAAVGLLDATVGVGGLVGGMVALVLAGRGTLARDFGLGVVAWAAPLLLVAAFPELWAALVAMAVIGLANSVVDVNAFTVLQRLVPDDVMGRVFGAMESAVIGGMALGSLAMPLLIHLVGIRTGLLVLGVAVTVVGLAALPGLSRVDATVLAPASLAVFRRVPMLAVLGPEVLERLARGAGTHRFAPGEPVFSEGDAGDRFHVIESGTVSVTIRGNHVRDLGPGDSFGEIALLRDVPRTATVTATGDLVTHSLTRDDFVPAVAGHGGAASEAERVVTRHLAIV